MRRIFGGVLTVRSVMLMGNEGFEDLFSAGFFSAMIFERVFYYYRGLGGRTGL
jgi:hypothetical protein